ncbi:MAG: oligosaccharide flippase family protein, partial [Planctomycetota bacterium]
MPPAIAISTPTPETQAPPGHFRVSHLQANLKGRSIRGATVSLGGQAAKFALQIGSTVILARLLTPGDFGLVAMVTAVTGFVTCVKDAGLSAATVQREEIDHAAISTLFWINLALSAALMLVVAALAPAI